VRRPVPRGEGQFSRARRGSEARAHTLPPRVIRAVGR
jgi:hypothetical protein